VLIPDTGRLQASPMTQPHVERWAHVSCLLASALDRSEWPAIRMVDLSVHGPVSSVSSGRSDWCPKPTAKGDPGG
jgi:hypothetical protein